MSLTVYQLLLLTLTIGFAFSRAKRRIEKRLTMPGPLNVDQAWKFPHLVSIQSNLNHMCGGGLISEQHVLSAAHCFVDKQTNNLYDDIVFGPLNVKAGIVRLNDPRYYYAEVKQIWVPRYYNASYMTYYISDIAVLKLRTRIDCYNSLNVRMLNLPHPDYVEFEAGWNALLAGFGNTTYPGSPNFDRSTGVNTLMLNIWNISDCRNALTGSNISLLNEKNYVCAYVPRNDGHLYGPCVGDSGSPLTIGNTVVGIVSSITMPCGVANQPSIFTRVSTWTYFIHEAMAGRSNENVAWKIYP